MAADALAHKAVVTCALTGVLTDPKTHPVPVSIQEMASDAEAAFNQGASVMHVHFRSQEPGKGHLPSWEPALCAQITGAIRKRCPGVIINQSTGVVGEDISGPAEVIKAIRPEIAACNAGTLNYLKTRRNGQWAWPPMVFDNPVSKIEAFLEVMKACDAQPEFECFDTGIVRSVRLFVERGMATRPDVNLVMGVASGMACDADLLPILLRCLGDDWPWQATLIGRDEIWPVHRRVAELGGNVRTGVEDTFYLPSGERTQGNAELIETLVKLVRETGREIASPDEARQKLNLKSASAS